MPGEMALRDPSPCHEPGSPHADASVEQNNQIGHIQTAVNDRFGAKGTESLEDTTMRTIPHLLLAIALPASLVACAADSKSESDPDPDKKPDVTVTWSDVKQTMDGFGASSAFFGDSISDEVADQLFDAKKGIGLSLLRMMIGLPDDIKSDGSEPTEDAKPIATAPELLTAQQAIVRGAKIWATAWTPPPIWKTTNNKNGKGEGFDSNKLDSSHYQDYADYLANFVKLMADKSVPLFGVSPANEPDYTAEWDGAQWSESELTTFISKNLGPTFKDKCPSVKIIAPDTAALPNLDKYVSSLFDDSAAKGYVSIVATHPYSGEDMKSYDKPRENNKGFWETEWSQENANGDTPDPTMKSALWMMKVMHTHLTKLNMSAWNWWAITISAAALKDADKPKIRQNPALIQPDEKMDKSYMFKRGWAFGHWSKFVRPGFKRIGATDEPVSGVLIEAYRDDDKRIVLTAINTNSDSTTLKFAVEGGSFGKLTPWVTSPNDDLKAKDSKDGGSSFSYELPGQSVVTFVNWDATKETPNQGTLPVINKPDGGTTTNQNGNLKCAEALVPSNGGPGGVTDFSDWSSQKWGDPSTLNGYKYTYAGTSTASSMGAEVDASGKFLHVTGTVMQGDYGGVGLSFLSCTTVKSFSKVQFSFSGSFPGCNVELQLKTYDQTPASGSPAGGCPADSSCYSYPTVTSVADPSEDTQTVEVPFTYFSRWDDNTPGQIIGLQWQWTAGPGIDTTTGCPIDAKISNIKFLP
jgi:O-glycosyl hydrolase